MRRDLIAAALLVASPACTFIVPPCSAEACYPFACGPEGTCLTQCDLDDPTTCAEGLVCTSTSLGNACEELCDPSRCDGHLRCDPDTNECLSECVVNDDCGSGYYCCKESGRECPNRDRGSCLELP